MRLSVLLLLPALTSQLSAPTHNLVIVESPAKATTISAILNKSAPPLPYKVLSCNGHVNDLSTVKTDLVAGVTKDYECVYTTPQSKKGVVSKIISAAESAEQIYIASDGDREGESIAHHLTKLVGGRGRRVVFNEITERAVTEAFRNPRDVDQDLVASQEARRIVDRLAGFTVCPVLWRKVAPGLSAGRVQSVGLRLIVDRERERMAFVRSEWHSLDAVWDLGGVEVKGVCTHVDGKEVATGRNFDEKGIISSNDLVHLTAAKSEETLTRLLGSSAPHLRDPSVATHKVTSVTAKTTSRTPPPPLTTSTMQQLCNTALGLAAADTMRAAQGLYEAGHISYMRTDSAHLSDDALAVIKSTILDKYGETYLAKAPSGGGKKQKKVKDQEAHEAIRPAIDNGAFTHPDDLPASTPKIQMNVYTLIYQRAVACHMAPKRVESTTATIDVSNQRSGASLSFKATGTVTTFPGFSAALPTSSDGNELPALDVDTVLKPSTIQPTQHTTQPPGRYTEATFVKTLEALGVGRPSTYASIIQTLRSRAYVTSPDDSRGKEATGGLISAQRAAGGAPGSGKGSMIPSLTAFVVSDLLAAHAAPYVDSEFTARMESALDAIAAGEEDKVEYLKAYYEGPKGLKKMVEEMDANVGEDARRAKIPTLDSDDIGLFVGPWGPFIVNSKGEKAPVPGGMVRDLEALNVKALKGVMAGRANNGTILGQDEEGKNVRVCVGRFGAYLQLGDTGEQGTRTQTLPKELGGMGGGGLLEGGYETLDFETALKYLSLPRKVGEYEGKKVEVNIGRFGPYVKWNSAFVSLPREHDVLDVSEVVALQLVVDGIINKKGSAKGVIADFGKVEGGTLTVRDGRFGVYLNWKKINAKIPKDWVDRPSEIPQEEAWAAILEKAEGATASKGKGKGKATKKAKEKKAAKSSGPKRPLSAYLFFCAEMRPDVTKTVTKLGDVSKELARRWGEDGLDKSKWEEMARVAKEEYEITRSEWKKSVGAQQVGVATEKKEKRGRSAYMNFCAAHREEVMQMKDGEGKKLSFGDVTKELALRWRNLGDEEKVSWKEDPK